MSPSLVANQICNRVATGQNVVNAIVEMGLTIDGGLSLMAGFEGELRAAHSKVKRGMWISSNNPACCPPDAT